jgi:hypothetical protein
MDDNVKNFLDKIEQLKTDKIKVDVLSMNKKIDAESLTFKQQKNIISTITDGIVGPLKFQKNLNDIIIENTNNKDLTVIDKLLIVLQLRIDSIGSEIKIADKKYDVLTDVVDKLKKIKHTTSKKLTGHVEIDLEVPTLMVESQIISTCIDILKKESDKDVGKSLSEIYTYEIVKYIKSLTLGEDSIQFTEIPVRDRVKIVNNLPVSINREIVEFIQSIKQKESDALKVDINEETHQIDIDISFFDA